MRTFFFYDLETSGFSARYDRIMQFAGQRTNDELELIGQPVNLLVKLTDDILPSPGAVLTTHVTPQMTVADGISEADFCRYFLEQVATPDTTILGYNSTRFDDEFIRHTLLRHLQWNNINQRLRGNHSTASMNAMTSDRTFQLSGEVINPLGRGISLILVLDIRVGL